MSKLAETYIHIKLDASQEQLYNLKKYLEYVASVAAKEHFKNEVYFEVIVEEGSIKIWVKVIGMIYVAISAYGSFRSGIEYMTKDSQMFSEYVINHLHQDSDMEGNFYRTERRLGTLGKITRLYKKLDEISIHLKSNTPIPREELEKIQLSISQILYELNSDQEKDLFLESIPNTIKLNLPKKLPVPFNDSRNIYAIPSGRFRFLNSTLSTDNDKEKGEKKKPLLLLGKKLLS